MTSDTGVGFATVEMYRGCWNVRVGGRPIFDAGVSYDHAIGIRDHLNATCARCIVAAKAGLKASHEKVKEQMRAAWRETKADLRRQLVAERKMLWAAEQQRNDWQRECTACHVREQAHTMRERSRVDQLDLANDISQNAAVIGSQLNNVLCRIQDIRKQAHAIHLAVRVPVDKEVQ